MEFIYTHTPFSALDRDRKSGALNETALNETTFSIRFYVKRMR